MQDNFSMNGWRLKTAITELEETEKIKGKDGKGCWKGYRYAGTENGKDKCVPIKEGEIGLSDILARDLFKLQGKISDDLFYKLRKAINSQNPEALAKAKEIMSRIKPEDERIYMGEEKGQCPDCGCEMEGKMCNECGYTMEEAATFTDKFDDNPELKGGQKDLPDTLQAKILSKEEFMDEAANPEGDALVLRFLQGIAKKYDYPVSHAAMFVKERIKSLGY